MNLLTKAVGATAIALSLATLAVPALAATGPTFSTATPWSGMGINSFQPDVRIFNRAEIAHLLDASKVSIVRLDTAWSSGDDSAKAFDAVNESDQAIHQLREAIDANPAAVRLLARNHVNVNTVVDIVETGSGTVQLYVS